MYPNALASEDTGQLRAFLACCNFATVVPTRVDDQAIRLAYVGACSFREWWPMRSGIPAEREVRIEPEPFS